MSRRWKLSVCLVSLLAAMVAVRPSEAVEIHSNGSGGGEWSDPETWHGGQVPSADDVVIVAMRDTVRLSGKDAVSADCQQLYIDPEGILALTAGRNQLTLTVAGPIESYGTIRMDGTKSPRGRVALRLVGSTAQERTVRLLENSALLAYGRKGLPEDSRNVLITAAQTEEENPGPPATIIAQGDAMIDLHHTRLSDVIVQASLIDNTGAKANQRLNVIGNHFVSLSRLMIDMCDTPVVRSNRFEAGDAKNEAAMYFNRCKLADIRSNRVGGSYGIGIYVHNDVGSSAAKNLVSGPARGIYWRHGTNAMIQDNTVSGCTTGLSLDSATGVAENTTIDKVTTAVSLTKSNVQFTTCHVTELAEDGIAMDLNASAVTLLNSNIGDDQIKIAGTPPGGAHAAVSMQFMIVKVDGRRPPGSRVQVQTAEVSGGVPQGKADLNVRNAPARLSESGFTPLPASTKAVVVRSWQLAANGKKENAPFYDVIVFAPSAAPDQPDQVLVSQVTEPNDGWFRAEPDSGTPNVEVKLP
jgi:parallel beta-helix repeat protein